MNGAANLRVTERAVDTARLVKAETVIAPWQLEELDQPPRLGFRVGDECFVLHLKGATE